MKQNPHHALHEENAERNTISISYDVYGRFSLSEIVNHKSLDTIA